MKMTGLLTRRSSDLTGIVGTARLLAPGAPLPRRLGPKDIAVADLGRMSPETARGLVDAGVAALVHSAPAGEDTLPRASYRILAASTIPVVEDVEPGSLTDGMRVRIEDGVVYRGEDELASGREVTSAQLLHQVDTAEKTMVDSALAHLANATEFLSIEHALLLDGEGLPEIDLDMRDRHVLVVDSGAEAGAQLADLKPFIREYRPVLVGVGAGAEVLRAAKYSPDLVVADPETVSDRVLTDGAVLVVPADRDGRCSGLDRITELGVGATTFPAAATARDMAMLLAHHGGAAMIVSTGPDTGLEDAYRDSSSPSGTVVERLVAARHVHAPACASLYRSRGGGVGLALIVLAALVAAAAVVLAKGAGHDVLDWAIHTWNTFALWVQGLLK